VAAIEAFGKGPDRRVTSDNRDSGYRESSGQSVYAFQHCDVQNPEKEIRLRSYGITVMWAGSLARRANV
jgi:hypothetical protein